MNSSKTVFSQLMDFIPTYEFRKCIERYHGEYKVKTFSCWDQFCRKGRVFSYNGGIMRIKGIGLICCTAGIVAMLAGCQMGAGKKSMMKAAAEPRQATKMERFLDGR